MDNELLIISNHLDTADSAEEVFGELAGTVTKNLARLKVIYFELAKKTHPDNYGKEDELAANRAFQRLGELYQEARERVKNNIYGKKEEKEIRTRKRTYRNIRTYRKGELTEVFRGQFTADDKKMRKVAIKLVANPRDSELMNNEIRILRALYKKAEGRFKTFKRYLPYIYEGFAIQNGTGRYVGNIFKLYDEYYSLREVIERYPDGVDGRDLAWMFNRLMEILGYIHQQGYVHGGITPDHILIHPEKHGIKLIDWTAAVKVGEKVRLMSTEFTKLYAPEILAKRPVSSATDIYMAGSTMEKLAGKKVPEAIKRRLRTCRIKQISRRLDDSWEIREQFDDTLSRLYGERKYHKFKM